MKAKITGTSYVLAVTDLVKSADFYRNKLGFSTLWEGGGWHTLIRDGARVMLGECPDDVPALETGCHSYFAYFDIQGIDALYEEYLSKELEILHRVENKPWGQREFVIRTIDGHRITFGETIR